MSSPPPKPDTDAVDGAAPKKKGKKKLILIALPVLLLAVGGGVAVALGVPQMLMGGGEDAHHEEKKEEKPPPKTAFLDMPDILVNLNTPGRKTTFLKVSVALEVADGAEVPQVQAVMPRLIDNFQVYLRELRPEDLKGSAGLYRLREELLVRVNHSTAPVKVADVLFKEMLVQ